MLMCVFAASVCVCVVQNVRRSIGNNSLNSGSDFFQQTDSPPVSFGIELESRGTLVQDIEGTTGFLTLTWLSK